MIDQKRINSKIGVVGSGRGLYVASLFILNIGLARSLGTVGFGSFQQVFIFSVLFLIFSLGIPETMYFFLPRLKEEEKPAFIAQTLSILLIAGIFVALFLLFGASTLAKIQKNPAIENELRIFGIYGAFFVASSFSDPVFIIFKHVKYLFILSALHGLFFIVLTIWQYFFNCSVLTLFVAMGCFGFFKFILALLFLIKIKHETGEIHFFRAKYNVLLQLSFAIPIALTNTIDLISLRLDKFVISFFLGTAPLGVFSVGAIEIPFVSVFVASVYSVISPVLNSLHHKKDYAGFTQLITKTLKLTAKFVWPAFMYLFVFADHLIPLVFTDDFCGAVDPFRIYLLLMPLRIFLSGIIIMAIGQPRVLFWASFWSLLLNIILNIFLVLKIGFLGPAIATVISTYLQVLVLLWFTLANLKIRIYELIPFRALFDILLSSVLAVLIAFTLTKTFAKDFKVVLISLTIFTGAYIFIGSKLGLFRILSIMDILEGNFLGKKDKN